MSRSQSQGLTPHWRYRDPREAELLPAVSAETLMAHARAIAAWERESGTPGEAQAYDHIERALKSYGYAVERREIEAFISLPLEGRVVLPDGAVIEGLTHAFSPSTDGLDAEVVDVGDGNPADFARAGAAGKIALLDSLATPGKAWAAQEAGTVGQIFVNRDHLHNMIVTTIWGTPEPDTAWRIPRTPCLSVRRVDGERIRKLIQEGRGRVRLVTRVRTGWSPIPHLTAHLDGTAEDRFVLFSGHVDGWHYGAMDNGTANATMLEVARLLATRRRALRRGFRLAFWSGHSHGRYAGSTWYADHAWQELHRRCAVHLNIDSTGARGATDYSVVHATEDAQSFVEGVVHDVTGQTPRARRFPRAGDQSFWGIGIPSALMSLSGIPQPGHRPLPVDGAPLRHRGLSLVVAHARGHDRQDRRRRPRARHARVRGGGAPPRRRAAASAGLRALRARDRGDRGGARLRRRPVGRGAGRSRPPGISPSGRRRSRGRSTPSPPAGTRIRPAWRPPTAPWAPCRGS